MREAWDLRRAALNADPAARPALLEHAARKLKAAARDCRDQGHDADYAQAIHLLANVETDRGDTDRALSLWEESVGLLRRCDEPLQLAHKVRHLGDAHRRAGNLDQASQCLAEALELYRTHDAPGSLDFANAVSRMAELEGASGRTAEALALWQETRDLYAAAGISAGVEQAEEQIQALEAR
ncbi:hypothetical protein ABI59_12835 [Acidobacteria bacterium Mor1]|nr:hypothetical protein ABI59_12835 [Acidobacteria bacterium Mor1]